jgi:hypothetical protein
MASKSKRPMARHRQVPYQEGMVAGKRKESIGMVCISRSYSIQCITAHYNHHTPKTMPDRST